MASIGQVEVSDASQRRERAAIAAQACQTCRTRYASVDRCVGDCFIPQSLGTLAYGRCNLLLLTGCHQEK